MIDPHSGVPAHRQLAELLRGRITSGEFPPGSLLPPQPRLRHEYGVGKATVQSAMATLRAEGLIEWERGIGVRVTEPVQDRRRVAMPRGASAIARPATSEERAEMGLAVGEHVQVVTLGGRVVGVHPASQVELTSR